jgi:hemoglobin
VTEQSFYDEIGGAATFETLIARFYEGVAVDPILRPMYPEEDLGPAADRLRMFFEQYFGGPKTYQEERGHPRLRMRHSPYAIDEAARDSWLRLMREAMDTLDLTEEQDDRLWEYMIMAAWGMQNVE